MTDKGELLIPASMLSDVPARKSIEAKWKQANISFGSDAVMTVVSSETAGLIKKRCRAAWLNLLVERIG